MIDLDSSRLRPVRRQGGSGTNSFYLPYSNYKYYLRKIYIKYFQLICIYCVSITINEDSKLILSASFIENNNNNKSFDFINK